MLCNGCLRQCLLRKQAMLQAHYQSSSRREKVDKLHFRMPMVEANTSMLLMKAIISFTLARNFLPYYTFCCFLDRYLPRDLQIDRLDYDLSPNAFRLYTS